FPGHRDRGASVAVRDVAVDEVDAPDPLHALRLQGMQPDRRPGPLVIAVARHVTHGTLDEADAGAIDRLVLHLQPIRRGLLHHAVPEFDQAAWTVVVDPRDPDARAPAAGHAATLES